jgi:hypothetical protein
MRKRQIHWIAARRRFGTHQCELFTSLIEYGEKVDLFPVELRKRRGETNASTWKLLRDSQERNQQTLKSHNLTERS